MTRRDLGRYAALAMGYKLAEGATLDYKWKLGVITDEVAFAPEKVLTDFCPKYGLKWVEIRYLTLDGKKLYVATEASPEQARKLRKMVDDAGLKISVLDSPVYKITLPGTTPEAADANDLHPVTGEYEKQLEQLRHAAAVAHTLGTNRVRIFSFKRVADPQSVASRVIDELGKAVAVAKTEGITLVLENEFDCNVAKGFEISHVLQSVPDRTLMLNWDPGNCYLAGQQPFPEAWKQFDHSRISHMHLKDAKGKAWMPIGSGDIDFHDQFKALEQMHYQGTLSLETHYRNAQKDLYTSSVESMDGLMKVLEQV